MRVKTYMDFSTDVLSRIANVKVDVQQSKFEVLDEESPFRLLHYETLTEEKYRIPLLIVYAFINRPYVLDMQPDISVVQKFLKAGFDVYLTDWGYPTVADQYLDLDDYVAYIDKNVELIKERKGVDHINLHGYCLGGTLSAIYTALRQSNVKNLILQAAAIDFHTDNTLARWARALDPDKIVDAYHVAQGEFLNTGFLLVNPINFIIGRYAGFLDMIESRQGMPSFLRMDQWIFDSPVIPGAAYRQYIKNWYHDNALIKGKFYALGEKVDLRKIRIPVLVVAAKYDHIAPPASQKAILDIVSSQDKEVYEMAKGHIGMTTSHDSHKEFWHRVVEWVEERSEGKHEIEQRNLARSASKNKRRRSES